MVESSSLPLWLTEDVTWPVLWGILFLGIFGFSWFISKQNAFLVGVIATLVAIGVVVIIEGRVVTDREYLVDVIHKMTKAVRANDVDKIAEHIHPENLPLRSRVYSDVGSYRVNSCNLIGFNRKDIHGDQNPPSADIGFAVWGTGTVRGSGPYSANVVVELNFHKSDGKWWLTGYRYRPSNSTSWHGGSGH